MITNEWQEVLEHVDSYHALPRFKKRDGMSEWYISDANWHDTIWECEKYSDAYFHFYFFRN
jgi:hypothetical protein